MAEVEKGKNTEESQTRDCEDTGATSNLHEVTQEPADDTIVNIDTAFDPASTGCLVTTSASTMDIGRNTPGASSFQEKTGEIPNLVLVVSMGILALVMQILSFSNLPQQLIFQSVIVSATSVSVVFCVSVVVDILRGVPPSSLKPPIYVALVGLFTSFFTYITALSLHHFFMIIWIYVLVCLSIFVHFILFKIVKARLNSPSLVE